MNPTPTTPTAAQPAYARTEFTYRPFIDPLNAHTLWWATLIPMALFLSIAYKAVRMKTLHNFPREVLIMSAQILVGMCGLGLALWLLTEVYLRFWHGG